MIVFLIITLLSLVSPFLIGIWHGMTYNPSDTENDVEEDVSRQESIESLDIQIDGYERLIKLYRLAIRGESDPKKQAALLAKQLAAIEKKQRVLEKRERLDE